MKALLSAALAIIILIGGWFVFSAYSSKNLDKFQETINEEIMPKVEASDETGNWDDIYRETKVLSKSWHEYKKVALFFLDTATINEIDYSMARSLKYVNARDDSNSSGELNAMVEQFKFLGDNEKVNWGNVF